MARCLAILAMLALEVPSSHTHAIIGSTNKASLGISYPLYMQCDTRYVGSVLGMYHEYYHVCQKSFRCLIPLQSHPVCVMLFLFF